MTDSDLDNDPLEQTIEKIEVAVEAEYRRRKPTMKSVPLDLLHASHAALSVIREIVLAEVRKQIRRNCGRCFGTGKHVDVLSRATVCRECGGAGFEMDDPTAAEIEARIIKVLGGRK